MAKARKKTVKPGARGAKKIIKKITSAPKRLGKAFINGIIDGKKKGGKKTVRPKKKR